MKKKLIGILLVVLCVSSLIGCSSEKSADAPASNDSESSESSSEAVEAKTDFIIGMSSDIKSIDPSEAGDSSTKTVINHVYASLLRAGTDSEGKYNGDIATSYEYVGDTEIRFEIRDDLVFSNGDPLTMDDILFSLQLKFDAPLSASSFSQVESLVKHSETSFSMITSEPAPALPSLLLESHVISKSVYESTEEKTEANFIGCGPMVLQEWNTNDSIILVKNEYYPDEVKASKITFKIIPESATRTIALETGEIDACIGIASIDYNKILENPDLEILEDSSLRIEFVGMNLSKAPFDNLLVRQAINMAVDREAINIVNNEGKGTIINTVVNQNVPGYNGDLEGYEYDTEKAKELLTEAGYPDGFSTTMNVVSSRAGTAELIQSDLKKIGIDVEILVTDKAKWIEVTRVGDHEMYVGGWGNSSEDPMYSMKIFYSENLGSSGNRCWYINPEVDAILDEAISELDFETRVQLYKDAQEIIVDDAVWVPLYCSNVMLGVQKGTDGIVFGKTDKHRFENMFVK